MKNVISKILLLTIVSFVFIGCSKNVVPTIFHDANKKVGFKYVHSPKLDMTSNAEIGVNIYSKSYLYYDNGYFVELLDSIVYKDSNINVNKNQKSKRNMYLSTWSNGKHNNIKSLCMFDAIHRDMCVSDLNNDGYFTNISSLIHMDKSKLLDKPVKYKLLPTRDTIFGKDSFKYEALYQGKIGNKIKISFREFKDDMARPAFTQNIEYELEKDGTALVGFKGLRVEVIKATNMDITYKVIKDYN